MRSGHRSGDVTISFPLRSDPLPFRPMFRSRVLLLALLLSPFATVLPAQAHGSHGGGDEALEAGEFDFTPIVMLEGHGGFENNLEDNPKHYAIDGLFGGVMKWGIGNGGSLTIEAAVGPALVWGEAEHFYGKVHVDDHGDHSGDDHDGHDDDEHADHDDHEGEEHADHDHDEHEHEEHADHDDHEGEEHADHDHDDHGHAHDAHVHGDPEFKRADVRGFLQVSYAPNDRLSVSIDWKPYYVTEDEGDDIEGLKNEFGAKVLWALGDGDVNFGLGDGLSDLLDGVFLSVEHRQGWESDGVWMGNYTDPRVGVGFKVGPDEINISLQAGPRFYTPGSYSGLSQRTDFAGELEISVPVGDATLYVHWQPTYSPEDAPGWGEGWQHHVGTGVMFTL